MNKIKTTGTQLNKFIAQSGLCSRRKAEELIKDGKITVNDQIIRESGYRVQEDDIVRFDHKIIKSEKKIYILLNKPSGYITTTSDEKSRRTVLDLITARISQRIYPVGRLDRTTTGLLLLTNDGELSQKLAHPSFKTEKIYLATLDKPLTQDDFNKILKGIRLIDGFIRADWLKFTDTKKTKIKIALHSGKNRIVRRIFKKLGYIVKKLDRTNYAGLTKKNLLQGKWRHLTKNEIENLQNISK